MNRALAALLATGIALAAAGCDTPPQATPSAPPHTTRIAHVAPASDATPRPTRSVERAARRAAMRFLRGYLRLTYDHGSTSPTVRALVRPLPSVPAAIRRLRPRIVSVELEWTSPDDATALASIHDATQNYPIALRLERRRGVVRVVALEP